MTNLLFKRLAVLAFAAIVILRSFGVLVLFQYPLITQGSGQDTHLSSQAMKFKFVKRDIPSPFVTPEEPKDNHVTVFDFYAPLTEALSHHPIASNVLLRAPPALR